MPMMMAKNKVNWLMTNPTKRDEQARKDHCRDVLGRAQLDVSPRQVLRDVVEHVGSFTHAAEVIRDEGTSSPRLYLSGLTRC